MGNEARPVPVEQWWEYDPLLPAVAKLALKNNCYLPYIPHQQYPFYDSVWKKKADEVMTPRVISTIYHNLLEKQLIPGYENPFTMVSYGSSLPTHEVHMYYLDAPKRSRGTRIAAIDQIPIKRDITWTMTNQNVWDAMREIGCKNPGSIHFENTELTNYSCQPASLDLVWDFKACLFYDRLLKVRHGMLTEDEGKQGTQSILQRFHSQLKQGGVIVTDMAERVEGEPFEEQTPVSTGETLLKESELYGLPALFDAEVVGSGNARVLALKKK